MQYFNEEMTIFENRGTACKMILLSNAITWCSFNSKFEMKNPQRLDTWQANKSTPPTKSLILCNNHSGFQWFNKQIIINTWRVTFSRKKKQIKEEIVFLTSFFPPFKSKKFRAINKINWNAMLWSAMCDKWEWATRCDRKRDAVFA